MRCWTILVVLAIILIPAIVDANEIIYLKSVSTQSPRSTLQSFIEVATEGWEREYGILKSVRASSRTMTDDDYGDLLQARAEILSASDAFEVDGLPVEVKRESERRFIAIMKDILDRVPLPPIDKVPDAEQMAKLGQTRWNIPGTPIWIAQVKSGRHTGEYLFSGESLNGLKDYWSILSHRDRHHSDFSEYFIYRPLDVAFLFGSYISPGWVMDMPNWMLVKYNDRPVWRWIVIVSSIGLSLIFYFIFNKWISYLKFRYLFTDDVRIFSALIMAIIFRCNEYFLRDVIHGVGFIFTYIIPAMYLLYMFSCAWFIWHLGIMVMDWFIRARGFEEESLDATLTRFCFYLFTVLIILSIIYTAGNNIGISSYSYVAGFSIIGVAASLSMQNSIANFFCSLIIMLEKPFAVGDNVQVAGGENGTVDGVGYRSLRIRKNDGTCVLVPSGKILEGPIVNHGPKKFRDIVIKMDVSRTNDPDLIRRFVGEIQDLLMHNEIINSETIEVGVNDFDANYFNILLEFKIRAPSDVEEVRYRQEILFEITRIADSIGISVS